MYSASNKKILIVDDERSMSELLSYSVSREGYITETADSGQECLSLIESFMPDLVLLDLMLPDANGYDICKIIIERYAIPVIMLTAKTDVIDKVLGLEFGADDYITKPFDLREVIARIRAALRRHEKAAIPFTADAAVHINDEIVIYKNERRVLYKNTILELTPKEYDLLLILAENKGTVLNRSFLLENIWGYSYPDNSRTVDIHIRRIRQKIGDHINQSIIQTVFGVGYKMKK